MSVETIVYKVEATAREGRKTPITRTRDGEGMTLAEAKAQATLLLTELLAVSPGWTNAETTIHYNVFFSV